MTGKNAMAPDTVVCQYITDTVAEMIAERDEVLNLLRDRTSPERCIERPGPPEVGAGVVGRSGPNA